MFQLREAVMHIEFYHINLKSDIRGVCTYFSRLFESFPLHGHDFYEFEVVVSGNGIHVLNGVSMPVSVGDYWALSPSDIHRLDSQSMEILNLRFYRNELPPSFEELFAHAVFPIYGMLTDDFERFCDYYWRFSRIAEYDRYLELEGISLAMLMLIILLRVSNKAAARPDCAMRSAYVKKAVSYLYTHYADPVCLDDVACFINI